MRSVICAALLLAAPAAAEPVAPSKPCAVTIARAPEEVRTVVEAWVRTEPVCSIALEIRVVPTDGGLYLLAQDERGRMRERIVPDAQTAGVLVASWIADDNAPAAPPRVAPTPAVLPPSIAPTPVRTPVVAPPAPTLPEKEMVAPPGLAPVALVDAAPRPPAHHSRWITVGVLRGLSPGSGTGARLDVDIWRRNGFVLGVAGSWVQARGYLATSSGLGEIQTYDTKVVATAAYTWLHGRWQLRPSIGVGLLQTEGTAWDSNTSYDLKGMSGTLDGSVMVSRELGASWAVYAGPLATLVTQEFDAHTDSGSYLMTVKRGTVDAALFAGVRHRL